MLILTLVFYPLANSLFFSFSFITSASVAPKYLNPFHLFLPLCRRFLRVFIEGMTLTLPFNVHVLWRNGRISEVCHLPDDITIKALNGSLTTYKLFDRTYGNDNHFKSGMCLPSPRDHRPGDTSMMACGTSSKRIRTSVLWNRKKARYSLWLFPIVLPKLHAWTDAE